VKTNNIPNHLLIKMIDALIPWVKKGIAKGTYKDCVAPDAPEKLLKEITNQINSAKLPKQESIFK